MFTALSTSFACKTQPSTSSAGAGEKVFERGMVNNIATALDIISGLAALFFSYYLGSGALAVVGGLQISPLLFMLALNCVARKEWHSNLPIKVQFNPCRQSCPLSCGYSANASGSADPTAALHTGSIDSKE
jgi:hypothetical protein